MEKEFEETAREMMRKMAEGLDALERKLARFESKMEKFESEMKEIKNKSHPRSPHDIILRRAKPLHGIGSYNTDVCSYKLPNGAPGLASRGIAGQELVDLPIKSPVCF